MSPKGEKRQHHFGFSWLPNTVTLFNLFTGFLSIVMVGQGRFRTAAWLIFISLLWDSLDGNIARAFKNPTSLGRELDSLADIVSFVVAPAFMALEFWSQKLIPWTLFVVFAYLGAGAYRLARFNVKSPAKYYFEGLPTPASAVILSTVVLACAKNNWAERSTFMFTLLGLMILLSFLMVSHIAYPKLSAIRFSKWSSLFYIELIIFAAVWLMANFETALASIFILFLFLSPAYGLALLRDAETEDGLTKSLK